ncbi:MAG: hypothetical protein IJ826_04450 [Bacteroidaceae bacterium]|nr:hypothetical protein [Bacteroidaceae bacterium]
MKRKFLLSLAIAFGVAGSAWALEKEGDIYQITSAQDMVDFAALVNGGETAVDAVLTQDIDMSELDSWTAIGDWNTGAVSSAYCGHFDGQSYKITGFNFTSNKNYFGIFGVISTGALIENFDIYGTMTLSHKTGGVVAYTRDATPTIRNIHSYVNIKCVETASATALRPGGILGSAVNGTTVVERCTYSGTIKVGEHTGNIGGIVGYVNNNAAAIVNITNCLFDGKIENGTADGQCGGVVGFSNKGKVTIKNCLSIGAITTGTGNDGMFFGRLNTSNSKFDGANYYIGTNINGTLSSASASGTAPTLVTAEQLASGEIAYALNGEQSDEVSWFQKLGTDGYPTPNGTDIVYPAGRQHCDGTAYEGVTGFSNAAGTQDAHDLVDGYCSYCGAIDADYMTANAEGFLEIGTPNQLKWFADYVNQIDPAADAMLTADIDLDGIAWTPIGNVNNKYSGTFDGQGYSITNFSYTATGDYNGLFGYVNNAIIKNFSISGTLTSTFSKNGVVGAADGASVVSGIHSALTINVSDFKGHTGGIVGGDGGNVAHTLLVENCEYSGILTHSGTGDCQAGILGYAYAGGVRNCVFSGTIIGENSKYGGILGYCKIVTFLGVKNCLSIGKIVADENCTTAAAIIANWNGGATENVKNNYYCLQEGSTTTIAIGNKSSNCTAPIEVTDSQLASGEVTYNLGSAFYQTIGTDEVPTLDNTRGIVKKISDAKFATTYFEGSDVTIPNGVTAYAATVNDNKVVLNAIDEKIAADDAVVLNAEEGYYSFIPTTGAIKAANNDLKISNGSIATDASNYVYALAKNEDKVGFRKVKEGVNVPAGKAYLKVAVSAGVKEFYPFGEEDATGIASPLGETGEGFSIYNLAGQNLSKLQKGVNIVGGKKVLF